MRLTDAEIDFLLDEDARFGDLTMRVLGVGDKPGRMTFTARRELVLCGSDEASRLLSRLGASVTFAAPTGTRLDKGTLLFEATGSAAALHAGWKTAQTLMEWASGIATLTHEIVSAARVAAPRIAVLCTRKAVPFTRRLSFRAIVAGGGEIHRLGLSDTIKIFDEHRAFLENHANLNAVVAQLRERAPERAIMIEVKSETGALRAVEAMADVIQLEKFDPGAVKRVVDRVQKRTDGRPVIAAAGGIGRQNAFEYAHAGPDVLITSAPYYAPPADIDVCFNLL